MSKVILHIDLNAFFVRCEEIKNSSLIGKPVAVGGDGRAGIVSTCSYKAREYGVHSGMPMFQARMLCKDLIVIPGDYHYYELMSKEFIHYIKRFSKTVEQMSIDECFADFTDIYNKYPGDSFLKFIKKMQDGLFLSTKLKCSIGIAPTKFLAKMGSDIKKPMGITVIRKKDVPNIIFPLKIKDFFGIGAKTYPRLEEIGIKTIGDLYKALQDKNNACYDIIGNFSDSIIAELEGNSSDKVSTEEWNPKSIGTTRTFDHDTDDKRYIREFLLNETDRILKELHSRQKLTKTIQLTYKDANYDTGFKTKTCSKSFKDLTDDEGFLKKEVLKLFDKTYDGTLIRLVGVTFQNLQDKSNSVVQMTFDNYDIHEKENSTYLLISSLNREANKELFFRASELDTKSKYGHK